MAVTGQELPRIEEAAAGKAGSRRGLERAWGGLRRPLLRIWHSIQRFIALTIFSSLTRRIVVLNLAGLAVLVIGILYLNQWRAGLIEARVQSLRVQGEIIAAAIAASATVASVVI